MNKSSLQDELFINLTCSAISHSTEEFGAASHAALDALYTVGRPASWRGTNRRTVHTMQRYDLYDYTRQLYYYYDYGTSTYIYANGLRVPAVTPATAYVAT